jgi:hypothetical protein
MLRQSGTVSYFINGNLQVQYSDTHNYTGQNLVVGRYYTDYDDHYIDGYISEPRLTIGQSLYNGIFGGTTPLTTGTNSVLLLLSQQNNLLKDSSTYNHLITNNGNVGFTNDLPSEFELQYQVDFLSF